MKTYVIQGYQAHGTTDPSAYFVDVYYRGKVLASFEGERAAERALRYVHQRNGRAEPQMGPRA